MLHEIEVSIRYMCSCAYKDLRTSAYESLKKCLTSDIKKRAITDIWLLPLVQHLADPSKPRGASVLEFLSHQHVERTALLSSSGV